MKDNEFLKNLNPNPSNIISRVAPEKVQEEMKKGAHQFHVIGIWIAIIFDPIFGITDYLNIPENWTQVFAIRVSVSIICLITLLLYQRNKISVYMLVTIPFALISLQNAYTYLLIDQEDIMGHNLNYLALFMGAGLFLIWPLRNSVIAIGLSAIATYAFVALNPALEMSMFAINGGLLLGSGSIFMILLVHARYRLRLREVQARLALNESLQITAQQKDEIAEKNQRLEKQATELQDAKQRIEQMNERLQDYNDKLEKEVAQRTQKLQKSNEEMDRLVYSLSHDFRTPMVNVQGLIQLAENEEKVDNLKTMVSHMKSSMNRFDELLHDMMNYSVYWNDELNYETFDICELIKEIWTEIQNQHEDEITLNLPDSKMIHSDKEKVRVVCYSILSNAIKYRKQNADSRLDIEGELKDGQLKMEFTDNGVGIEQEALPKVFDMFYRGHRSSMGAGLGLYIAKGVIAQLNGIIHISSVENKGTTATIHLPTGNVSN